MLQLCAAVFFLAVLGCGRAGHPVAEKSPGAGTNDNGQSGRKPIGSKPNLPELLDKPTQFDLVDFRLETAARFISEYWHVPIILDQGVPAGAIVRIKHKGTGRECLDEMLSPLGLKWSVVGGEIHVQRPRGGADVPEN